MDGLRGTTTGGDGWGLDGADLVGIGCSGFDGGQGRLDGEDLMIFVRGLGVACDWAGGVDFWCLGSLDSWGLGWFS